MNVILSYLAYGSGLSDLGARENLTLNAFVVALENVPFGILSTYKNHQILEIISNHSFVLDTVGIFGFLGLFYVFWVFFPIVKRFSERRFIALFPVFSAFILLWKAG